jgi:ribonuclease R
MSKQIQERILNHLKSQAYQPTKPRRLAHELNLAGDEHYPTFREALLELRREGRVSLGAKGAVVLPSQRVGVGVDGGILGTYRHNPRGFGFVVPSDSHEDLYIPEGENAGAITGDLVRAKITSRGQRDGRTIYTGRITDIVTRTHKRFAGTLQKQAGQWVVTPDGNTLTQPINTPDAGSRHIKPGTKVVVELTSYPTDTNPRAQGVITEILGKAGEKDVDLKSVIVQFNLPEDFPDEVKQQARDALDTFDPRTEQSRRLDLTDDIICTIDPDDAKDYDDAISLKRLPDGDWELGVHIADVSFFVKEDTPLDLEARERGNSTYFPGHVIPMLPEVLSNGVCSLQEAVPRLTKSAFITLDADGHPTGTRFANSIIKSRKRLRYTEAQDIIDGKAEIRHPDGNRKRTDYERDIVDLLAQMDQLARVIQRRRRKAGQLVLDLPVIELVLDDEGKVVDAVPEDQSFTHTIIEMFMVEANEAVARLLDSLNVPFLRRIHPEPEVQDAQRLRHFSQVTGYQLPKDLDRHALQALLDKVKGKPEAFALNMAVLRSLTRAEYSPEVVGHFALASEHYTHFTSPIRRYADLTIHRLLDAYFEATGATFSRGAQRRVKGGRKSKPVLENIPSESDLVELGKHISFTERRSEEAERELRKVKILELLQHHVGDEYLGVVTGIAGFGLFVQLNEWLIDGMIRYEDLLDDWWDVDERSGQVRGERTGQKIGIGDVVKVVIVKVDVPRRQLDLAITEVRGRPGAPPAPGKRGKQGSRQQQQVAQAHGAVVNRHHKHRGGQSRRNRQSKNRSGRRR